MQSCEVSVPTIAIYQKTKHQETPKCFQSSAKPKIHLLEGNVPSTGKDTYQMKKPSLCLFWEWLSHGAQSKIFLWAGVGGLGGGSGDIQWRRTSRPQLLALWLLTSPTRPLPVIHSQNYCVLAKLRDFVASPQCWKVAQVDALKDKVRKLYTIMNSFCRRVSDALNVLFLLVMGQEIKRRVRGTGESEGGREKLMGCFQFTKPFLNPVALAKCWGLWTRLPTSTSPTCSKHSRV